MISNPFLPAPSAAKAWAEGFTKGFVAISSPTPSDNVSADDIDAFNQGIQAGAESSQTGISLGDSCVPALEEDSSIHEMIPGAEIAHGLWELKALKTAAGGVAGIVVGVIELLMTLPVHTLPPEQVLPRLGQPTVDELASYGMDPIVLFCGAGLDPTVTDCEIKLTPMFASLDLARQAAIAMERFQWLVASWSPVVDQSSPDTTVFGIADSGVR